MNKTEAIKFLAELMEKINKQDNRMTASPYYFAVQTKVGRVVDPDYVSDITEYYFPDHECAYSEEDIQKMDTEERLDTFGEDMEKVEDILLAGEERHVKYGYVTRGIFLTEEAANDHIQANKHHYDKPRTYVHDFRRNPEMEKFFEAISAVSGVKWDKK